MFKHNIIRCAIMGLGIILITLAPSRIEEGKLNGHQSSYEESVGKELVQNLLFVAEIALDNKNKREARKLVAEAEQIMKKYALNEPGLNEQISNIKNKLRKN